MRIIAVENITYLTAVMYNNKAVDVRAQRYAAPHYFLCGRRRAEGHRTDSNVVSHADTFPP